MSRQTWKHLILNFPQTSLHDVHFILITFENNSELFWKSEHYIPNLNYLPIEWICRLQSTICCRLLIFVGFMLNAFRKEYGMHLCSLIAMCILFKQILLTIKQLSGYEDIFYEYFCTIILYVFWLKYQCIK